MTRHLLGALTSEAAGRDSAVSDEPSKAPSVAGRALDVLDLIGTSEEPLSLAELTAALGLPRATVHRFAILLEQRGFSSRSFDGKRWGIGPRLSALAVSALQNSVQWGARRALLASLVGEIGETCNITIRNGTELIYLDRVESSWPLQIRLSTGSKVPMHCTASGKLFLSLSPPHVRRALIGTGPLPRHTSRTITDPERLLEDLRRIADTRVGTDDGEFIDGMAAAAVPVLDQRGAICATVAVHGPVTRLPLARAVALAPSLRHTAEALAATYLKPV